jgi:tetratricopeptide (TPR) repeat protein
MAISKHPRVPDPLKGDPKRQALGLFKGINFQVWQTVLAWIDLREDQALYVEGAEDFDVVANASGISVQIKASERPITLHTEAVVAAIRSYWLLRHNNAPKEVRFRFVTTAVIGCETGAALGHKEAGLSIWTISSRERDPDLAEKIRTFLLQDHATAQRLAQPFSAPIPGLIEFLKSASRQVVLKELIQPISWETSQGNVETAKEAVRLRLHAYGEKVNLLPQDADLAMAPLFERVADTAFRNKRALGRDDFIELFDRSTRVTVPRQQFASLMAQLAAPSASPSKGIQVAGDDSAMSEILQGGLPPLPEPCCHRDNLTRGHLTTLRRSQMLVLFGTTGSGKSTQGNLVARCFSEPWSRITFPKRTRVELGILLRMLVKRFDSDASMRNVLFDDVDLSGPEGVIVVRSLAAASLAIKARDGRVIITSQKPLPSLFFLELGADQDCQTVLPYLSQPEISDLCRLWSCPDEDLAQRWGRVIFFQTSGHPQLVRARLMRLRISNWPAPAAAEIIQVPKEIHEERQLTRQLLQELSEEQRETLYRLTLSAHPFRRDQAVLFAETPPPVSRAGEIFESLVGPWIEPVSGNYFQLSPLLVRAAEAVWSSQRINELRAALCLSIIKSQKLTLTDASEALLQALASGREELAGLVLMPLVCMPRTRDDLMAAELSWLLSFTGPKEVFSQFPFLNMLLRDLQFRIAVSSQHDDTAKFAAWLEEESMRPKAPEIGSLIQSAGATTLLISVQVPLPPDQLLRCWLRASGLRATDPDVKSLTVKFRQGPGRASKLLSKDMGSKELFRFILMRQAGPDYLEAFVSAIDNLPPTDQVRVLDMSSECAAQLQNFTDRAWIRELDRPARDWNRVIVALRTVYEGGKRWRRAAFVVAAARGIAAVQDEYLGQADAALETLSRAAMDAGQDALMLRYQRGTVLFRQQKYSDAFEVWHGTLNRWDLNEVENAIHSIHAHSNCGIAAAMAGNWILAGQIFERGRTVARKVGNSIATIQFGADGAYALWRGGEKLRAIGLFARCLRELASTLRHRNEPELHTTWKMVEHIIKWCAIDTGMMRSRESAPPPAGLCSEVKPSERHDEVKAFPKGPPETMWLLLAEAEARINGGKVAYNEACKRAKKSRVPLAQFMLAKLRIVRRFADRRFDGWINDLLLLARCCFNAAADSVVMTGAPVPRPELPSADVFAKQSLEELLACALITEASAGRDPMKRISEWQREARRGGANADCISLVQSAQTILGLDPISAYKRYPERGRFEGAIISLRLSHFPDSSLSLCFVGCLSFVTDDALGLRIVDMDLAIGELIRRIWLQRLQFTTEFRLARLTAPAVRAACEDPAKGIRLASRILLAAHSAVNVGLQPDVISKLRTLAL